MISPYVRRLRLAEELRTLRSEAGVTHEQLAKQIGESRAQISRLENGHVVDQADIIKILDALGVEDDRWTEVVTIAREAGERGWWESNKSMGERQALYANLEAGAETIREFQMTFLPGLLQTPEYARERIAIDRQSGGVGFTVEKAVEARIGRQRMLRRPGGPKYHVIIDEVAVRRPAATSEVVSAQLYHLAATVNGSDSISMRVLPVNSQVEGYNVPRTSFAIYTFHDESDPTVVMVDTATDDVPLTDIDKADEVKRYDEQFTNLWDASLAETESLDFVVRIAKEHHIDAMEG